MQANSEKIEKLFKKAEAMNALRCSKENSRLAETIHNSLAIRRERYKEGVQRLSEIRSYEIAEKVENKFIPTKRCVGRDGSEILKATLDDLSVNFIATNSKFRRTFYDCLFEKPTTIAEVFQFLTEAGISILDFVTHYPNTFEEILGAIDQRYEKLCVHLKVNLECYDNTSIQHSFCDGDSLKELYEELIEQRKRTHGLRVEKYKPLFEELYWDFKFNEDAIFEMMKNLNSKSADGKYQAIFEAEIEDKGFIYGLAAKRGRGDESDRLDFSISMRSSKGKVIYDKVIDLNKSAHCGSSFISQFIYIDDYEKENKRGILLDFEDFYNHAYPLLYEFLKKLKESA